MLLWNLTACPYAQVHRRFLILSFVRMQGAGLAVPSGRDGSLYVNTTALEPLAGVGRSWSPKARLKSAPRRRALAKQRAATDREEQKSG